MTVPAADSVFFLAAGPPGFLLRSVAAPFLHCLHRLTVLVQSQWRSSSFDTAVRCRVAVMLAACTLKCSGDLHDDMAHSEADMLWFEQYRAGNLVRR